MNPTTEQVTAVEMAKTGDSFAIEAGAGTGKTSTLVLIAVALIRLAGQYIAFNKAITEEAKLKMPRNVRCNTAHSLAYRAVGYKFKDRMNGARMRSTDAARMLGLNEFRVEYGKETKRLAPGWLAGMVNKTISNFCNSDAPAPTSWHVPYVDGLDVPNQDGSRRYDNNRELAAHLMPAVFRAWDDICDLNGKLRFNADHYLKMWQLDRPVISADFILFDEAQDASPVMLDIVRQQRAQIVWVGDTQQQIYEWRGAVNALDSVDAQQRTFLTQSFRFGQPIADVANLILGKLDAELRLGGVGGPSVVGMAEEHDAVLCRTNAGAFTMLFRAMKEGQRPHIVGGGKEIASFAKAAQELMSGKRTIHPELSCFETWGEVQDYVDHDAEGGDLRLMVKLVEEFGVDAIIEAIENMPPEERADLIISTAHKAKGREWDRVRLYEDFPSGPTKEKPDLKPISAPDWRLMYVAATRARLHLDVEDCFAIRNLMKPEVDAPLLLPPVSMPEEAHPLQRDRLRDGRVCPVKSGICTNANCAGECVEVQRQRIEAEPIDEMVEYLRNPPAVATGTIDALNHSLAIRAGDDPEGRAVPVPSFEDASITLDLNMTPEESNALAMTLIRDGGTAGILTVEGTVSISAARPDDHVRGVFYRSQATGNVRAHYGDVEHVAKVVRRYGGGPDKPYAERPHVWAEPVCGSPEGRVVPVDAAQARKAHRITFCERCAIKLAAGQS